MDTKRVLILGTGHTLHRSYFEDYEAMPAQVDWDQHGSGDCKNDHGDRTNPKLRDQPFYHRANNGKMKKW